MSLGKGVNGPDVSGTIGSVRRQMGQREIHRQDDKSRPSTLTGGFRTQQKVDAIEQFECVMTEPVKRSVWIFKDISNEGGSGIMKEIRRPLKLKLKMTHHNMWYSLFFSLGGLSVVIQTD